MAPGMQLQVLRRRVRWARVERNEKLYDAKTYPAHYCLYFWVSDKTKTQLYVTCSISARKSKTKRLFKAAVFSGLGSQALLLLCHCVYGKHIQEASEVQCALLSTNLEHMQRSDVVHAWVWGDGGFGLMQVRLDFCSGRRNSINRQWKST